MRTLAVEDDACRLGVQRVGRTINAMIRSAVASGEITPIKDGQWGIVGSIEILRDRTARRQAQDAILEERRALEILNRAGSRLAAQTALQQLVQIVTDAGVELTGAEFRAVFYNVLDQTVESYMLSQPARACRLGT